MADFLNGKEGTLLIGVDDTGKAVKPSTFERAIRPALYPLSEAVKYVRIRWGEEEAMGTKRHDHDFNWAKATRECSIPVAAMMLRDAVIVRVREACKDGPFRFKELSDHHFRACRHPETFWKPDRCVHFQVEPNRVVISYAEVHKVLSTFAVTTTLNDQAECRYQINGSGEYLRCQIVETALKELFSK